MPPPNNPQNKKKKKKGRAPAHQNKFAFQHNPKSKTTERILNSPNIRVCQRCYDKIEWRKQYRKYKPRTQPGSCNGCKKRNVLSAYHTICAKCTTDSIKAKEVIREASASSSSSSSSPEITDDEEDRNEILRACAVCVKELALKDPVEDETADANELVSALGQMKLREKKTLERKIAKQLDAAEEEDTSQVDISKVDDDDYDTSSHTSNGDDV